ncbi:MAG: hypothetical protein LBH19_15085 [Dysgonamonadaceae bacterium]|jgi:hypothetical protein|nr:hypothetical protein [Dysgonamonadaceae bacterium]
MATVITQKSGISNKLAQSKIDWAKPGPATSIEEFQEMIRDSEKSGTMSFEQYHKEMNVWMASR